jgi:hypothetical protein
VALLLSFSSYLFGGTFCDSIVVRENHHWDGPKHVLVLSLAIYTCFYIV